MVMISLLKSRKGLWVLILSIFLFFIGGAWVNMRYEDQLERIKEKSTKRQSFSLTGFNKVFLEAGVSSISNQKVDYANVEFSASVQDVVVEFNQYSTSVKSEVTDGILKINLLALAPAGGWNVVYRDHLKVILPLQVSGLSVKDIRVVGFSGDKNTNLSSVNIDLRGCDVQLNIGQIVISSMSIRRECHSDMKEDNLYQAAVDIDEKSEIQFLKLVTPVGRFIVNENNRIGRVDLIVGERVSITAPAQFLQKANLKTIAGSCLSAPGTLGEAGCLMR